MSVIKDIKLVCDGINCMPAIIDGSGCFTVSEVRKIAKDQDWVYRKGKDFCPDCK